MGTQKLLVPPRLLWRWDVVVRCVGNAANDTHAKDYWCCLSSTGQCGALHTTEKGGTRCKVQATM